MDKKNEFMRRAIELSEESVRTGGGPFGAVIVRGDEIIYQEMPLKPEQRHKTMQRLMGMEALKAFRMWEESADKTEY